MPALPRCRRPRGTRLPTTLLTVYASNETLCFRAKGLTDRQLRRHLDTLETAGLIRRRDSANGKRFPVMQHGKPIGAFGLDLSPLSAQSGALLALALRRREEADELRGLRAQILRLRAACADMRLDATLTAFIDGLRNLVRRTSPTLTEARATLARLTAVLSFHTAPQATADHQIERDEDSQPSSPAARNLVSGTGSIVLRNGTEALPRTPDHAEHNAHAIETTRQMPASDGQNDRHIEQESDTQKRTRVAEPIPDWATLTEVSAFYDESFSAQDATRIAFEFGKMLRISQDILVSAASKIGLCGLLRLEDRMARHVGSILNPDAYVRSALRA